MVFAYLVLGEIRRQIHFIKHTRQKEKPKEEKMERNFIKEENV